MTAEQFQAEMKAAMNDWVESFKKPTEVFKVRLDDLIKRSEAEGLDKGMRVFLMIQGALQLEKDLDQVVGNALTPELMPIVATKK